MSSTTVSMPRASATSGSGSSVSPVGVGLRHQTAPSVRSAPNARDAERGRHRAVDAARDPDDGSPPAQLAPDESRAAQSTISLGDRLRVDLEDVAASSSRPATGVGHAACLSASSPRTHDVSIESRFSGISRRPAMRMSYSSSRKPTSSRTPVESIIPASISELEPCSAPGSWPRKKFAARNVTDLLFHDR